MPARSATPRRRTVLVGVGTAVAGSAFGTMGVSGQETADASFVLEQGEDCVPITPLSSDQPVEDFFDWNQAGTQYSSAGTVDLQRPDTSVLFLYRGQSGRLSLVLVHGALDTEASIDETAGGSVTMRFLDVPGGAEWVVRDDYYDDPSNYDRWRTDQRPQAVDWTWAGNRTDGGVLAGLGEGFDVTVEPAFNDAAALAGEYYDGQISDWQVLSGGPNDPDRTPLALDQPIRIRRGTCEEETATETDAEPLDMSIDVVPGRVNPDGEGVLPVDATLPDGLSVSQVDLESIGADPGGASPVSVSGREDGDALRLFFPVGELDLPASDSEPLIVTGETADGRTLRAEDTLDLTPNAGRSDDGDEGGEGEDDDGDDGEDDDGDDGEDDDGDDDEDDFFDDEDLFDEDDDENDDDENDDDENDDGENDDDEDRDDEDDRGRGWGRGRGRGRGGDDDDDDGDEDDDDDEDGLGIGALPL